MTVTFQNSSNLETKRLQLRSDGMFSNVNEVVEHLRLANLYGYRFVIDWAKSCYLDRDIAGDPWLYYFTACFPVTESNSFSEDLPTGKSVSCTRENIITPRLTNGVCNPLMLPRDRYGANKLIESYIAIQPEVGKGIEEFYSNNFRPKMIGAHIRGPGRLDGGAAEMRRKHNKPGTVPFDLYFNQIDQALKHLPEAGLFICSDSSTVIDIVSARYGDRVCCWNAQRSEFGEMHANHRQNKGLEFSPYRLGLDIVSEAWLLSRTDIFVHGNSNVANFVLCKSPDLIHAYVQA